MGEHVGQWAGAVDRPGAKLSSPIQTFSTMSEDSAQRNHFPGSLDLQAARGEASTPEQGPGPSPKDPQLIRGAQLHC